MHVLRPCSTHRPTEITAAPKVYGFDTGFVCYYRGWHDLRREDRGLLWEHFVLNELIGQLQTRHINYWRDKRGHEMDFIIAGRNRPPVAIECKWSASDFRPANMKAFRRQYPGGRNYLVAHDIDTAYRRTFEAMDVAFVNLNGLLASLLEQHRQQQEALQE